MQDPLIHALKSWRLPEDKIDEIHDCARASFDSVKDLTEYEDAKAGRLLAVIAFLTAAIAAVFARLSSSYPWPHDATCDQLCWLTRAAYLLFFLYLILVAYGTLRVFEAIIPRFNIPGGWKSTTSSKLPASMLFFEKILAVKREAWGTAFSSLVESDNLKAYYVKNYIFEARLIAEKVAEKLAALQHGLWWIKIAMIVLIGFFIACGLTFVFAPIHTPAGP